MEMSRFGVQRPVGDWKPGGNGGTVVMLGLGSLELPLY